MPAKPAEPEFNVGDRVAYTDHHGRPNVGRVLIIQARWTDAPWPHISYTVEHPTYQNRRMHTDRVCKAQSS